MDSSQKSKIRKQIEAEVKKITDSLPLLKKAAEPVAPDNSLGRLTRMDAMASQKLHAASLKSAQERMRKLNQAVSRMDEDDFGLCADCDEIIPEGRLLLIPETRLCVKCAQTMLG